MQYIISIIGPDKSSPHLNTFFFPKYWLKSTLNSFALDSVAE